MLNGLDLERREKCINVKENMVIVKLFFYDVSTDLEVPETIPVTRVELSRVLISLGYTVQITNGKAKWIKAEVPKVEDC
jgi:hypothetical protein